MMVLEDCFFGWIFPHQTEEGGCVIQFDNDIFLCQWVAKKINTNQYIFVP